MHEEYDSVGDRGQGEPSTSILETLAVAEQHKPEGMVGSGERSMIEVDRDAETKEEKADEDGREKPLRGKRGTKDGAERNQDRQYGPSTIGINGESCVGKQRRFVDTGGLRRATKDTDTEVGVMACSTAREHDEQRESEKRVMRSSKDRSTSTHSEKSIDIRGKPTEGNHGAGRDAVHHWSWCIQTCVRLILSHMPECNTL